MKICFIAEGSYPYMVGGVSSWLKTLMKCLPEHELKTFTIGAKDKDVGKFVYTMPYNMTHIEETFLDTPFKKKVSWFPGGVIRSDREKEVLINHFSGKFSDWPAIFEMIKKMKKERIIDFFNCSDFFEIVRGIYDKNYGNAPFNDFLWTIRTMFMIQFYVLKVDIPEADIYHSVLNGLSGVVASNAAYFEGKPFILTEHGIYMREREEEIIKSNVIKEYMKGLWINYFQSMSLCAYHFADKIVTQFERNRDIQIELGADPEKTVIIPNGINADDYDYDYSFGERPHSEDIVVGAVARIVPIKDIITMVEAYAKAKEKVSRIKLVIIGPMGEDEHYNTYVQNYVRERDIPDVTFTGKVSDDKYTKLLHSMDIFLLTSISEGQPLSVLEAMAYGKPSIVTDVGSCGELILGRVDNTGGTGDAGIVVPVMNQKAVADAIIRLASDRDLRTKMGQIARLRVLKDYTVKRMKDSYTRLYETVLH